MNERNYKIVLMSPLPPPYGGIAAWAERFVSSSNKYNIQVSVVNESFYGRKHIFGLGSKITIISQIKRNRMIWKELKQQIKGKKIDIVHCCIPSFSLSMLREIVSMKIAHKNKVKFIFHFRCTIPQVSSGTINKLLLRKIIKKSDGIIVLNNKSKQYLESLSKSKIKPMISVIPNFVLSNEADNCFCKINNEIKKVIYVGGVIKEKGCDLILDVALSMPWIKFVLIGNPSKEIIDYINLKNIKNVYCLGEKSKEIVKKEMCSSDLFLFLSRFQAEGFSNSLLEAMYYGLPCIVTDWASNKEQVGDYSDVCVVDNSVVSVLEAFKKIESVKVRKDISEYNKNRVSEFYSENIVMNYYKDFYKKCIEK